MTGRVKESEGTSLAQIAQGARRLGHDAEVISAESIASENLSPLDKLKAAIASGKKVIIWANTIRMGQGKLDSHYILVTGIGADGKIQVSDPGTGKRSLADIDPAKFLKGWASHGYSAVAVGHAKNPNSD
jgi:hypothetical protein